MGSGLVPDFQGPGPLRQTMYVCLCLHVRLSPSPFRSKSYLDPLPHFPESSLLPSAASPWLIPYGLREKRGHSTGVYVACGWLWVDSWNQHVRKETSARITSKHRAGNNSLWAALDVAQSPLIPPITVCVGYGHVIYSALSPHIHIMGFW